MKNILYFLLSFLIIACSSSSENEQNDLDVNDHTGSYKVVVHQLPSDGYGFSIYKGDKIIIQQKNIPALQGNIAFKNKEDAEKVAQLMIYKMENNIFPPTVSVEELDSLGID